MNTYAAYDRNFEPRPPSSPARTLPVPGEPVIRHLHRERDFGVGYGNSSGYASRARYTRDWVQPLFRCA